MYLSLYPCILCNAKDTRKDTYKNIRILGFFVLGVIANALNSPPEEYGRKVKTQRNRRGLTQVVEHVV